MTQRETMLNDSELDDLFADAKRDAQVPSTDLMERILADAQAEQVTQSAGVPAWTQAKAPVNPMPWWQRCLDVLGGWGGATGLATATVAGLAFGLGAPDTVNTLASGVWSAEPTLEAADAASYALDDLVPSFYDLAIEG